MSVKTDVAPITAFRLELLNDPNLPLGGPGPVDQGDGGARPSSGSRPRRPTARASRSTVKFSRATADVNPPETPLEPIFDDKSGKKRVTGPIGFAIDGKDETAWGIDVGPGRRNQPRKAVFTAEKPIAFPGGTILTFHLTQNHGGWNSDDNQNHNLGRFRLSITTAPDATADPVPAARPGDPGDPARANGPPPRRPPSSATGGRPSRNGRRPTPGSIRSGGSIPRDRRNWCFAERDKRRPTHMLQRGDFLKPGKTVEPGVPVVLEPAARRARRRRG